MLRLDNETCRLTHKHLCNWLELTSLAEVAYEALLWNISPKQSRQTSLLLCCSHAYFATPPSPIETSANGRLFQLHKTSILRFNMILRSQVADYDIQSNIRNHWEQATYLLSYQAKHRSSNNLALKPAHAFGLRTFKKTAGTAKQHSIDSSKPSQAHLPLRLEKSMQTLCFQACRHT